MHCVHLDHSPCDDTAIEPRTFVIASTTWVSMDIHSSDHLSYSLQSQKHSFSSFILQLGHLVITIYLFPLHLDLVIYLLSLALSVVKSLLKIKLWAVSVDRITTPHERTHLTN